MKTAIIKTSFWKEDRMFDLTPDIRYFYLCLLTNPERNTTPAFKCSDRLMSAYTGYNSETIALCRKTLIEKDFIKYVDGYYILNRQDYVEPTKGKLSQTLYDKNLAELPKNIAKLLRSESGAVHEYIDKDNNKDNSSSKSDKEKQIFGEFQKVRLTTEEHEKLVNLMGERNTHVLIAELDGYIASKNKKYASHYATILNWARRKVGEIKNKKSVNAF